MTLRTFELLYPKRVDTYRVVTEKMIDEIVANSNVNTRYPVAIGHDAAIGYSQNGDASPAAGVFRNLRKSDNGFLIGDVDLQPEVEEQYKKGVYPGWSVGIFRVEGDKNKEEIDPGWQMDHLALLGSVGAAFKDLQEVESQRFSLVNKEENACTVECFNGFGKKNKTMWLIQSTNKAVTFEQSQPPDNDGGKETMDKEIQEKMTAQEMELSQLRADREALKAEKEALAADKEALLKAKADSMAEEFKGIKCEILKQAADKGVTEPAREGLRTALDACDAHYSNGVVTRELFEAFTKVLGELKPKIEPGEATYSENDAFELKQKFSGREAVSALYSNPEA